MSEATSRRRSRGNERKSYRIEDEYSFLDEEQGSGASGTQTPDIPDADEDGDDFMPDVEEEAEEEFDDGLVDEVESDEAYSGEERPFTPRINVVAFGSETPAPSKTNNSKRSGKTQAKEKSRRQLRTPIRSTQGGVSVSKAEGSVQRRTRGVADFTKAGGQEVRLRDLYGPANEDLLKLVATRDHWRAQETFPERAPGSQRRSFFESPGAWEEESREARQWYADTGREIFARTQKSESLDAKAGQKYLQNNGADSINVLAGPTNAPEVSNLTKLSYIHVGKPFQDNRDRRGWLLYLGTRIQDAHWAAVEVNETQYFAVAVEQKSAEASQTKNTRTSKSPAFAVTDPFGGSIQIWALKADKNGGMDSTREPQLQVVVCAEWGTPKQVRWCPVDTTSVTNADGTTETHIGLLAAIWSDGNVRLLDVSTPKDSETPYYMHVTQAAFDVAIPQAVPSCLHWLSGTTLAVATAAGTLAIWTLTRAETFPPVKSSPSTPKPWFYQQVADTYILTLSSGWPSQPHFISITTADGFARLYDIRTPNADNTTSIRGRTLCLTQDWHEHTQSFVMPDEHYIVKHNPIRRYYHNLYSMRAESTVTRVATSPVHPGVLMGGADGRIETTNPVPRIANYKVVPWQQTWFLHEWRGPIDRLAVEVPGADAVMGGGSGPTDNDAATEASDPGLRKPSKEILSQPLVRITEGYKAFQPGIQHSVMSKKPANPEAGKGITIHEEKSAITTLVWNPNLKFGTWALAGMGSGLLRVEDVGV